MQGAILERQTMSKVKVRLIPYLVILYFFCLLDRVNVGYAALTMNADLGISAAEYGLVAGIFFIGYFLFEVPSNIIMTKVGARIWIGRILVTWGLISALCGFIHTATHLYIARFLLGVMEAGFYPGIMLFMTYWFPARERAKVVTLFMLALPLSAVLGAPISGLILDYVHWFGLESWRWLFLLEGLPTFFAGIVTFFILPDRPKDAKWLNDDEKAWLENTMANESSSIAKKHKQSKWNALTGGTVWLLAIIYFSKTCAFYGVSFFAPTLIKHLTVGLSNFEIGIFNAVPLIIASVFMIFWSKHSDKTGERHYHVAVSVFLCGCGVVGLGITTSPVFAFIFLTIVFCGAYSIYGSFWAMVSMRFTGEFAAIAMAAINSIANLGGFVGPVGIGALRAMTGSNQYGFYLITAFLMISTVIAIALKKQGKKVA